MRPHFITDADSPSPLHKFPNSPAARSRVAASGESNNTASRESAPDAITAFLPSAARTNFVRPRHWQQMPTHNRRCKTSAQQRLLHAASPYGVMRIMPQHVALPAPLAATTFCSDLQQHMSSYPPAGIVPQHSHTRVPPLGAKLQINERPATCTCHSSDSHNSSTVGRPTSKTRRLHASAPTLALYKQLSY